MGVWDSIKHVLGRGLGFCSISYFHSITIAAMRILLAVCGFICCISRSGRVIGGLGNELAGFLKFLGESGGSRRATAVGRHGGRELKSGDGEFYES